MQTNTSDDTHLNPNPQPFCKVKDDPKSIADGKSKSWRDVVGGSKIHPGFVEKTFHTVSQESLTGCSFSSWKGAPVLDVSSEAVDRASKPFSRSIIFKFLGNRPLFNDFQKSLMEMNVHPDTRILSLRYNKALVMFQSQEDFSRFLSKRLWNFCGTVTRTYRSRTEICEEAEPPLAPVWFHIPNPPLILFDKLILLDIARMLGDPLSLDSATASLSRPNQVKFLVEVDLSKSLPEGFWLKVEGCEHIWLQFLPEKLPSFCTNCHVVGHVTESCNYKLENRRAVNGHLIKTQKKEEWIRKEAPNSPVAEKVNEEPLAIIEDCDMHESTGIRVLPGPLSLAQNGDSEQVKGNNLLSPQELKNLEVNSGLPRRGSGDMEKGEGIFAKMMRPEEPFSDSEATHIRRNELATQSKLTEEDHKLIEKAMAKGKRKKCRESNLLDMERDIMNLEIEMMKGDRPRDFSKKEMKEMHASEDRALKMMDSVSLFSSDFSELDEWEQWQDKLKEKKRKDGASSSKPKKPMRFNMAPRRSARFQ